jgi:DNA-binding MarR family transcriptional regulator
MMAARDRAQLERLDVALGAIRRLWEQPQVKGWFQSRLDLDAVDAPMYRTLRAVRQCESGDCSVNGVAAALRVDGSTASRFVDRAVAAGMVHRSTAAEDRRRSSLELTPQGRARLVQLREVRVQFLASLTRDWPSGDVEVLTALLRRLDVAVEGLGGDDDD